MPSGRSGIVLKAGEGDVEMRTYVETYVDLDIDEIISDLSNKEKQELSDELFKEGFVPAKMPTWYASDFDKLVSKIIGNKHRLTIDEERIICDIAERIVL